MKTGFRLPVLGILFALFALAPLRSAAFDPFNVAGIDQKPNAQLPLDARFVDQRGRATTLNGVLNRKPTVLIPVLHNCPNICGVTLSGVMEAIRTQDYRPGRDFTLVAFGIDPKEGPDDAEHTIETLSGRYADQSAGITALTGGKGEIRRVTDALGYRYAWDERIGQYAHIAATAILTPDGRLSRWLYGLQPSPDDLRLALTEAAQGKLGSWSDQLLLLCYHYDPTTGRYSSLIWIFLRAGGVATAGLMVAGLAFAFIREKRGGAVDD